LNLRTKGASRDGSVAPSNLKPFDDVDDDDDDDGNDDNDDDDDDFKFLPGDGAS